MTRSLALVVALATPASSQFGPGTPFPIVDATNDRVVFVSEFDGSLSPGTPVDLVPHGVVDPVHAVMHFGLFHLWVSDRTTDSIYRMDWNGNPVGVINTGLDDVRGILAGFQTVYVANRGSGNGAPGPSIVMFDRFGAPLGSFPVNDPSGLYWHSSGDLLVGNLAGHDLDRYTTAGTFVGKFHDSDGVTGIDAPMQITTVGCRGRFLCAGDGANPGIYEYDAAGAQVGHFATPSGVRGVRELRNGNWLYTDANGVHVRDFRTGTTIDVLPGVDAWFIGESYVELPPSHAFCLPWETSCPCGNNAPASCIEGCLNSLGSGAILQGDGYPSISADSAVLHARNMPSTATVLFFQGTIPHNGGMGSPFGDGVRCAGGSTIRLGTKQATNGFASYPGPGDAPISVRGQVTSSGERTYQGWYRNAASFCTAATFNLTNGWRIFWIP